MKKYTVIYSDFFQVGSHTSSITKMLHVECEPENLKDTVAKEVDWSSVWFVLDGQCEQTKD